MLRTTRILMALFLGLCLIGCDSTPAPQAVSPSPQPLPASIPYHPTKVHADSAKQVAFTGIKTSDGTKPGKF